MTAATWILALATVALALATVTAVIVTARIVRTDRRRDDARRAEDRKQDAKARQEDRDWYAAQLKAERERDDRLRREAADEWDRRNRAEQRAREDYEARQVTIQLTTSMPQWIEISAPATYPIKQVTAHIAHWTGSNLGIVPIGHAGSGPRTRDGRTSWTFPAAVPPDALYPEPIVSFVDQHGNLYYNLKGHTARFPQGTEPINAAALIDLWLGTGPKPDDPA